MDSEWFYHAHSYFICCGHSLEHGQMSSILEQLEFNAYRAILCFVYAAGCVSRVYGCQFIHKCAWYVLLHSTSLMLTNTCEP